jgi:CDP-diacylglycerol--glycerol-3-phosphate 3-phosphatidyltransferase
MNKIPGILLYARPFFIATILIATFYPATQTRLIVLGLITVCILSDIFDGIIARQLNISSQHFRLLDTLFDLAFYITSLYYVWSVNPEVILENSTMLIILLALETLLYTISITRFGQLPSPHAFLSKIWGLYLAIEFFLLILKVDGNHFRMALWFGLIVHIDRVLIYALLRKWDHDIPSCYHAWLLRQGKLIIRHKLLNG